MSVLSGQALVTWLAFSKLRGEIVAIQLGKVKHYIYKEGLAKEFKMKDFGEVKYVTNLNRMLGQEGKEAINNLASIY